MSLVFFPFHVLRFVRNSVSDKKDYSTWPQIARLYKSQLWWEVEAQTQEREAIMTLYVLDDGDAQRCTVPVVLRIDNNDPGDNTTVLPLFRYYSLYLWATSFSPGWQKLLPINKAYGTEGEGWNQILLVILVATNTTKHDAE